jgi:uncharacterized protein YggT (Ycf19 family)
MQSDPYERRIVQEEVVQTPHGANASVVEQRVRVDPSPAEQRLGALYRARYIVWFLVDLLAALIALRFALLLLGADTSTGFGNLILSITQPFVAPFLPLFGAQGGRFEIGDLVAIVMYLLVGWAINKLITIALAPRVPPAAY